MQLASMQIMAPKAGMPKVFTDKLTGMESHCAQLQTIIDNLQQKNRQTDERLNKLESTITELSAENQKLKNEAVNLTSLLSQQTAALSVMQGAISAQNNATVNVAPEARAAMDEAAAAEQNLQDNIWNTAIRKMFTGAMRMEDMSALQPMQKGSWFVPDEVTGGKGMLLCPDFTLQWKQNEGWHKWLVSFVRSNGFTFDPHLTAQFLETKTDKDILLRLKELFKNGKDAYKKARKPVEQLAIIRRAERQQAHKKEKVNQKKTVRTEAGLDDPRWDYLFEKDYQSTDDSNNGNDADCKAGDPDTDGEKDINPAAMAMQRHGYRMVTCTAGEA
ncbi:hypothetical protein EWM64_g8860 [Hericium alpestre]|uniref:Uncharacterized protein n=1 Tax=Hericium alpestre TaxID=135208 RepID=A0A4Y9ZMF7_9AGAM|nr:hypothetical protein EWM64_g8860 [Hericium alpestre]